MNFKSINCTFYKILIFSIILQACVKKDIEVSSNAMNTSNDSITIWINASKNELNTLQDRKQFLTKAYQAITSNQIDTLKVRKLSTISYETLNSKDTLLFKMRNEETLAIAKKLKDTFALGDVHWNYASYYNDKLVFDSAYYHFNLAHTYFTKAGYIFESAKTQYGMAFIKGRFKDYSASEFLTFRAIQKFKKIEDYKSLFSCYDLLGQLQKDIDEFDRALFYYDKASEYIKKTNDSQSLNEANLNNIANVYIKKKEYSKALNYYDEILKNSSLKKQSILRYSRIIDNKAFCRFLMKDTINVINDLNEALRIKDSINNKEGIVISKIRLAYYFSYKNDTTRAISLTKEANNLAKEIKNSRDYLESLFLLSKLDKKQSSEYLKMYIQFNDSLQIVDRKTQNKFARIDFETDEYIEEAKRLSEQKILILITSSGLILIIGLLFFLRIQKSKTEKLRLLNEQQKAKEQVYLLTIRQQEKLEKEKIKERNRIAEELHDGVLGKLFGTRFGLGFLEIEGDEIVKEKHQLFLSELQTIEKEIRDVSHKLSDNFESIQIGFTDIVRELIESKSEIGNFEFELDIDENINWEYLDETIKVNLNRLLQEALQNIIKYAFAKKVSIIFFYKNKNLVVIIKDDGVGFDINKKRKGIGLKNMESRVKKINGNFTIYSKHNEGTTIKIQIPI